jgi:hypothetical protein
MGATKRIIDAAKSKAANAIAISQEYVPADRAEWALWLKANATEISLQAAIQIKGSTHES